MVKQSYYPEWSLELIHVKRHHAVLTPVSGLELSCLFMRFIIPRVLVTNLLL